MPVFRENELTRRPWVELPGLEGSPRLEAELAGIRARAAARGCTQEELALSVALAFALGRRRDAGAP